MTKSGDIITWNSLPVGAERRSGALVVQKQDIIEFAQKYDPLPQHLSEQACTDLGISLCASGIQVLALVQLQMCEILYKHCHLVLGSEISAYSMRQPLLPDDPFYVIARVENKERHARKPDCWWMTLMVVAESAEKGIIGQYSIRVFVREP